MWWYQYDLQQLNSTGRIADSEIGPLAGVQSAFRVVLFPSGNLVFLNSLVLTPSLASSSVIIITPHLICCLPSFTVLISFLLRFTIENISNLPVYEITLIIAPLFSAAFAAFMYSYCQKCFSFLVIYLFIHSNNKNLLNTIMCQVPVGIYC